MTIRERTEAQEKQTLCGWATLAAASKGRQRSLSDCPNRTCFQRDRDVLSIQNHSVGCLTKHRYLFRRKATITAHGLPIPWKWHKLGVP